MKLCVYPQWLAVAALALAVITFVGCTTVEPECLSDLDCPGALVCADSLCQRVGCSPGSDGCECVAGRCGRSGDGAPLLCGDNNVCASPSCPAGQNGCTCVDGEGCDGDSDICAEGYCVAADCEAGTRECSCVAGTCDLGLHCLDGALCVDRAGYEGGACLDHGRCHRGARCDGILDVCVFCEFGTEGCACNEANVCSLGLACIADACVSAQNLAPEDPSCYTPCRDSFEDGSGERICDSEGLMAGCIDDQTCLRGSCVEEGDSPPSCEGDLDCPGHQVCLRGREAGVLGCYSNCAQDADCSSGFGCRQHVCRVPCETRTGAAVCGAGLQCVAEDGANGFCQPAADAETGRTETHGDGFVLSQSYLSLSNVTASATLEISLPDTSADSLPEEAAIHALWHEITTPGGTRRRVEAERDPVSGALCYGDGCECPSGVCPQPLYWLSVSAGSTAAIMLPSASFELNEAVSSLEITMASDLEAVRFTGEFEIVLSGGRRTVTVDYVASAAGQWTGTMYYFGTFGTTGLDAWSDAPSSADAELVGNALIRRWGAFRAGNLEGGWDEMAAVLTSIETESWRSAAIGALCERSFPSGVCYPYSNAAGFRPLASRVSAAPVPAGATELPITLNLRSTSAFGLEGRIESGRTLHYPGAPAISITFETDPGASCTADECITWMADLRAESVVGGQFVGPDGSCAEGLTASDEPWLLEGFEANVEYDEEGQAFRSRCVDVQVPFSADETRTITEAEALNRNLASASPVPDGRARRRSLSLLDGAIIDQRRMVVLFKETFDSFLMLDDEDAQAEAYGYMVLSRSAAPELDPAAYLGSVPEVVIRDDMRTGAQCSASLLSSVVPGRMRLQDLSTSMLRSFVDVVLHGSGGTVLPTSQVHYYCESTGALDGGPEDDGSAVALPVACPEGSRVVFFSTSLSQSEIAALPCQSDVVCSGASCSGGTCQATLTLMRLGGQVEIYDPPYQCTSGGAYCDDDLNDRRAGKTFYRPGVGALGSLQAEIESAFRFRTRFRSSSGGSRVGFAPEICLPNSDEVPYCYSPSEIEDSRDRIDCLLAVYSDRALLEQLTSGGRAGLELFLRSNFSEFTEAGESRDGFERLYAELLVMLGDESLTRSFTSRFDLAAVRGERFRGSAFEDDGLDLSGVAGFELSQLYRAVQYYQSALDRLYGQGGDWSVALGRSATVDSSRVFVSAETVTLYLERLIRASTQKARALSEIAKRYQGFNRPDLARRVVERSYVSTYMESAMLARLMDAISERSTSADRPQIDQTLEASQARYRLALLQMRDVYASITDETTFLGLDPDYVPLPVLDASAIGRGPVEFMLQRLQAKTDLARSRELEALSSNRSFQADTATFQSELARLRNGYEAQLGQLCGSFRTADGSVVPAIRRYASQSNETAQLGDPCGRVGNGAIYTGILDYQNRLLGQRQMHARIENLLQEVEIERQRVNQQCDLDLTLADYQFESARRTRNLQDSINEVRLTTDLLNRSITAAADLVASLLCIPGGATQCLNEYASGGIRMVASIALATNTGINQTKINDKESRLSEIEADTAHWNTSARCDFVEIDSNARTETLMLGMRELELDALRASWAARLSMSQIEQRLNQAQRLQAELEEAETLLIDVEAARNDPNIRIYRNDAVVNADIAFEDALRAAYRATRAFEYYTGQTYPQRGRLYLIRMITAGDYNLDNYQLELEEAFLEFENCHGARATRVLYLSLMDDMFEIPRIDQEGRAIPQSERFERLRARIQSPGLLDGSGNIVLGFRTSLERVSPLTRLHDIKWIEAEIAGTSGDHIGRLRLRQMGTGLRHNLDGDLDYHVFDARRSVMNAFFNGSRVESPDYYQSYTLRGRPLINTAWELVFDPNDPANSDIQLETLTDMRLYIYYTDYTAGSECR